MIRASHDGVAYGNLGVHLPDREVVTIDQSLWDGLVQQVLRRVCPALALGPVL